jgi:hypothetical protein
MAIFAISNASLVRLRLPEATLKAQFPLGNLLDAEVDCVASHFGLSLSELSGLVEVSEGVEASWLPFGFFAVPILNCVVCVFHSCFSRNGCGQLQPSEETRPFRR